MKKLLTITAVLLLCCCGGCEFVSGLGAGAAGQEALSSWQTKLEEQKVELEARYEAAFAELKSAPDPNTIALAKEKLDEIQRVQIGNSAALLTIGTMLKLPNTSGGGDRNDVIISSLLGAGVLALREWQKRTLAMKYVAMKAGKAAFEIAEPDAGKKLHTIIGAERMSRGL